MDNYFNTWSQLHGGAQVKGVVKVWLTIAYKAARTLTKLKVRPNAITLLGLLFAVATWRFAHSWFSALLIIFSLIFDGLDGSLAILQNVTSRTGAVIDSVVDRISEFFWALALVAIGANWAVVFAAVALASSQEYLRARAGGLGLTQIGVVSIAERPVRAIITAIALLSIHSSLKLVNGLAIIWLLIQFFAFVQVSKSAKARLLS